MNTTEETSQQVLADRVAIVTGGARGLGRACADRLAQLGARVAVFDLALGRGTSSQAPPRDHRSLKVDVTDAAAVAAAFDDVADAFGPPTILINAAGALRPTRFLDITETEWDLVMAATVKGTFLCAQAALPRMIDAGFGRIVNFSSTAGKSVSTVGGAHYTTAKAAVLGLTRAIAKEVACAGITVNAVCPGLFETEMTVAAVGRDELDRFARGFPIARLGEAVELAALVAFLCSAEAAYITGAAIDINGGDLMI